MTNLYGIMNRPEYIYQPWAAVKRVFGRTTAIYGSKIVKLRWNLTVEVNLGEAIGRAIAHHGLFEIPVVEAIFRLTDPADVFLDVGANIGFMSAAAIAAGAKKVISFEPHPELFRRLSRNFEMWKSSRPEIAARLHAREMAISQANGKVKLQISEEEFPTNQGTSSLEIGNHGRWVEIEVMSTTLNKIIDECDGSTAVMKIDIEGHEIKVFQSAQKALASRRIRDIVFEDHAGISSEVSQLLRTYGYSVFGLNKTLAGPVLLENEESVKRFRLLSNDGLNFLATLNPFRARQRMSPRGYRCLGTCLSAANI